MKPSEKMIEAGQQMASDLMTASVCWCGNGLGGSKSWREFISQPLANKDLIQRYINHEICSVEAIYIAMRREVKLTKTRKLNFNT